MTLLSRRRSLRIESLENRQLLAAEAVSGPMLWMQDNSYGNQLGLAPDFVERFQNPQDWELTLRAIDTLSLREDAVRSGNGLTAAVLRDTVAPVLNRNHVGVSISTRAARFLNRRIEATGQTHDQLLADHFDFLQNMIDAGIRVQSVSLNGPMSRIIAGDPNWAAYSAQDRISDVIEYSLRLQQRFPDIDVGIVDNLPTFRSDWQTLYWQVYDSLQARGIELDHIHLFHPVDRIGPNQGMQWSEVIDVQDFVQDQLQTEFGFVTYSDGAPSDQAWRKDVIFEGIQDYLAETPRNGSAPEYPDRFIIAAFGPHPQVSYPEYAFERDANGVMQRVESLSNTIRQASNLIRGLNDSRAQTLKDEVRQVQPVNVWSNDNQASARDVAMGASLVDGQDIIENRQWIPNVASSVTSTGNEYWMKLQMPTAVDLDRVRIWPARDGATQSKQALVRVFSSNTGNGMVGDANWQSVGQLSFDGRQADSFTVPISALQTEFLGIQISYENANGPHDVVGLGAVRVYSPNNGWNSLLVGKDPVDPPDAPEIRIHKHPIMENDPGATLGKVIADCCDAAGKYDLTVDDDRFDFFLSFLRLKPGISVDRSLEPTIQLNVTLTERSNPSRVFTQSFSFDVLDELDGNGQPRDIYDWGDAWYEYQTFGALGPRHRVGGLFLGQSVDTELHAQNEYRGRGDDLDADGNDDDGIDLPPLQTSTIDIGHTLFATASTGGMLDGWIDYNGNQTFDHPQEHIGLGNSIALSAGSNAVNFTIPANSITGKTFARFRISSVGGLLPTGMANDGEVEDYQVRIESTQPSGPEITWQNYLVVSGIEGATAAKILANGHDADGRYQLSANDARFEFERSFLRLKSSEFLNQQVEPEVVVLITLTDKQDDSRQFSRYLTIRVRDQQTELFDFGDAPYRFDTTRYENGARHRITQLSLGRTVDAEGDGQNQYQALGDDIDASGDDEDGVVLVNDLFTGMADSVGTVVVDASAAAKLDAWIDFNGNGRFDHPLEHLAQNSLGTSIAVQEGMNVIDFVVPTGAISGTTYARFRLSDEGNLLPTGVASSGEVEDYRWEIKRAETTTVARFEWPELLLFDQPAMNVVIQQFNEHVTIVQADRTLARYPTATTEQVHIVGGRPR